MDKKENTGIDNSGNWNTGHRNTGHRNTGHWNSGDCNSGDLNSGNCNSGSWNSGSWNSGHRNSGHRNSGHRNSGDWNSGDLNSGNCNSGSWNSGDRTGGNFCTTTSYRMFNKECSEKEYFCNKPCWLYFTITKWITDKDMTDQEKIDNPKFHVRGGYLKTTPYKEAAQAAWDKASQEEREATLKLPNFDADIFYEIFGIDIRVAHYADPSGKVLPNLYDVPTQDLLEELQRREKEKYD